MMMMTFIFGLSFISKYLVTVNNVPKIDKSSMSEMNWKSFWNMLRYGAGGVAQW